MALPLLAGSVMVLLVLAYRFYGAFIARQYALDPAAVTPAVRLNDGVDFVPTRKSYLLGQHFSAIAAAGPIAGPILAVQQFGWLPALLWIGLGVVFIGAVHDMSALIASVRHKGQSIAEVIRENLGPGAGIAMMGFIWIALVYLIVAFTDVTASTFVSGDSDLKGLDFTFNPGGAVAASSIMYLTLAVIMGLVSRFLKPPLWLQTIIFVPLTLVAVYAGSRFSTFFILETKSWAALILLYCFVASLLPLWSLLQPRGYLGGFVLYTAIAVGLIGMFFGGFAIEQPAFRGWVAPGSVGLLFPFLFVTIACGACSGFHGLVSSGTTSKQLEKEPDAHPVGYGAMLMEGLVAVIAMATIMIVSTAATEGKAAGAIYGAGLGRFLTTIIGERNAVFAITFGAMAFSTFVFDTLDVSTRLGRYILQELFGWRTKVSAMVATAITCGIPLAFVTMAGTGSWRFFWTLFGTSNQLLAALSLMGVTVWLKKSGRRFWFAFWPMVFIGIVTIVALVFQIRSGLFADTASVVERINGFVSLVLLALAGTLLYFGVRALSEKTPAPPVVPTINGGL